MFFVAQALIFGDISIELISLRNSLRKQFAKTRKYIGDIDFLWFLKHGDSTDTFQHW